MTTEHTPEKWTVAGYDKLNGVPVLVVQAIERQPGNNSIEAFCPGPNAAANAHRIVACVNACEGLNPEAVPGLLEALQAISGMTVRKDTNHKQLSALCMAVAEIAIAQATESGQ